MSTAHPRHLARLLAVVCVLALTAAIVIIGCQPDTAHPPECVTASRPDVVINPTALPAFPTTSMSTTSSTTTSATTTTTPAPPETNRAPTPAVAGDDEVLAAIARWFPDLYDQAVGVANCESTMHADARAGPNYGLFQINRVHVDQWADVTGTSFASSWSDPNLNAQFARWLYDEQGWGPWACRWAAR